MVRLYKLLLVELRDRLRLPLPAPTEQTSAVLGYRDLATCPTFISLNAELVTCRTSGQRNRGSSVNAAHRPRKLLVPCPSLKAFRTVAGGPIGRAIAPFAVAANQNRDYRRLDL